jgi:hypothetical protein
MLNVGALCVVLLVATFDSIQEGLVWGSSHWSRDQPLIGSVSCLVQHRHRLAIGSARAVCDKATAG